MQVVKRSNGNLPAFAKFWDGFLNDDFFKSAAPGRVAFNTNVPAVNVKETEDQFELDLAAPGLEKKDFEIQVHENVLTISNEKKEVTKDEEKENYSRREFSFQAFKRTFNLPETVDANNIKAAYKNGILNVIIPKKEETKPLPPKRIKIS